MDTKNINQNGYSFPIPVIIGVLIVLGIGLGMYYFSSKQIVNQQNKSVLISQPQKEIASNIKIGKYEVLYKGGWEELNYIDSANAKNPDELYEIFSSLYPKDTDKSSEFFIKNIILKNDTAEVYFGGDEGAITDRMGTTGPYIYSGLVTFALTEDEKIKKVDFKLKTEGNHFGPRISTRDDFIYLWPTQLLEKVASTGDKKAREVIESRTRLSDETSNWKTYTNTEAKVSLRYPSEWKIEVRQPDGESKRISIEGKEGSILLDYGSGFGGACQSAYEDFNIGNAQTKACHSTLDDGSEKWSLSDIKKSDKSDINDINYEGFVTANTPFKDNRDIILKILSTFKFTN